MDCPHPDKVRYFTKHDALVAWRGHRKADQLKGRSGRRRRGTISIYRCPSGDHWHLGRRRPHR